MSEKKSKILDRLSFGALLDGGMGSLILNAVNKTGIIPERLNYENPEIIYKIHYDYFSAGSDIVYANTFGANPLKYPDWANMITSGISIAKRAANDFSALQGVNTTGVDKFVDNKSLSKINKIEKLVALDIGSTGKVIGTDVSFANAVQSFSDCISVGAAADLIVIETMTDLNELRAAVIAAREVCPEKVIMASMSFNKNLRSLFGAGVGAFAVTADSLGADIIGINCSLPPSELFKHVKELLNYTCKPLFIKPNAGMPVFSQGITSYNLSKEVFVADMRKIYDMGVKILGGCCGSTPEFIKGLKDFMPENPQNKNLSDEENKSQTDEGRSSGEKNKSQTDEGRSSGEKNKSQTDEGRSSGGKSKSQTNEGRSSGGKSQTNEEKSNIANNESSINEQSTSGLGKKSTAESYLCSSSTVVKTCGAIIGEGINPTGKKELTNALSSEDYDFLLDLGAEQMASGADILDVNVNIGDGEKQKMAAAVDAISTMLKAPISIDTIDPDVLEAGLQNFCGKALVNSFNLGDESYKKILSLAKKYGAAVVGMCIDGGGIPSSAKERAKVGLELFKTALDYGIKQEDIYIDPIVLSECVCPGGAAVTLETIKMLKANNINVIVGLSNVSYGLKERASLNAAFYRKLKEAGANLIIMNPAHATLPLEKKADDFLNTGDLEDFLNN